MILDEMMNGGDSSTAEEYAVVEDLDANEEECLQAFDI